jgi:hypothetical protein
MITKLKIIPEKDLDKYLEKGYLACLMGDMECGQSSAQHHKEKWLLCRKLAHAHYWSSAVAGLIIMCVPPKTWNIACELLLVVAFI